MAKIALVDLSGIFHAAWHATGEDEVTRARQYTLNKVRSVVHGYDHIGICVDRPPYKRRELSDKYKANREKAPNVLIEQLKQTEAELAKDFHILGSKGYEADDIIATVVEWALANDHTVMIHSNDKDLMQLICERVQVQSTATGDVYDAAAVEKKFGVHPELVQDLLALVGDKSDGVVGLKGVGPKTAEKWLKAHGDLAGVIENAASLKPEKYQEIVAGSRELLGINWKLIQLLTDAPIDPAVILTEVERVPEPVKPDPADEAENPIPKAEPVVETQPEIVEAPKPETRAVTQYTPTTWDKALEPRDPRQAWGVAVALHKSRMFGDWPTPESVLACVMTGRSFGMDAVSSLRGFQNIKGRMATSAQTIVGLIKRTSLCEWFRLVESTPECATWETKRRGEPEPVQMSFTIEEARAAGYIKPGGNWDKIPKTMLRWRAATELARAVFPDITAGLYSIEELQDMGGTK